MATHGQEVMNKGWLGQFEGYRYGKRLRYGKNIDAVTGATISANNILKEIKKITEIINIIVFD